MPFVLMLGILCASGANPGPDPAAGPSAAMIAPEPAAPSPSRAGSSADPGAGTGKVLARVAALGGPNDSSPTTEAEPSQAEQIAGLKRAIASDTGALAEMRAELEHPESEYAQAEAEFKEIDEAYRAAAEALKAVGEQDHSEAAEARRAERDDLEQGRTLARERFDLAIEERRVLKQKIATLDQKLAQEQAALDRLTGEGEAPPSPTATGGASTPLPTPATAATAPESTTPADPAKATTPESATATPTEGASTAPAPLPDPAAIGPAAGVLDPGATGPQRPTGAEVEPPSEELVKAEADAQVKAEAAREAEADAKSVADRMGLLDTAIEQERALLEMARKKADNAHATRAELARELQERSVGGATPAELNEIVLRVRKAEARSREARREVRERTDRLDERVNERSELLREQNAALRNAEAAREQLQVAESKIESLKNPFAPRNVLQWLLDHAPRILAILLGMALLQWSSKLLTRRIVHLISRGGISGTRAEREGRAETLVGVFRNAVSVVIVTGGILMVFQEVGIPIAPLMGGAAVLGLAVAFGAQNLIRDYFYGFVILLENQYKLNDVVKIGEQAGQVEQITLRMTVLRDMEGTVHFIPNGEITSVSNMTHGWSRAVFDIRVAYKEDADRVMDVLLEIARELRRDAHFGRLILEDPTMLGVDALDESAVIVKFYIKTRPITQWEVKREMLRRVKRRFDELGIEVPFPSRALYHRHDDGDGGQDAEGLVGPHDSPRNIRVSG